MLQFRAELHAIFYHLLLRSAARKTFIVCYEMLAEAQHNIKFLKLK